jgi:hypothetical protein
MPLSLPGREPAEPEGLLERHRPCLRERRPVLGAVVEHITHLEATIAQ